MTDLIRFRSGIMDAVGGVSGLGAPGLDEDSMDPLRDAVFLRDAAYAPLEVADLEQASQGTPWVGLSCLPRVPRASNYPSMKALGPPKSTLRTSGST